MTGYLIICFEEIYIIYMKMKCIEVVKTTTMTTRTTASAVFFQIFRIFDSNHIHSNLLIAMQISPLSRKAINSQAKKLDFKFSPSIFGIIRYHFDIYLYINSKQTRFDRSNSSRVN